MQQHTNLGEGSSRLILLMFWCSSWAKYCCGGALSTLGLLSMLCRALRPMLNWLSRLRLSPLLEAQKPLQAAAAAAACCAWCCCCCRASSSICCCWAWVV